MAIGLGIGLGIGLLRESAASGKPVAAGRGSESIAADGAAEGAAVATAVALAIGMG